jgi:glyoxylase-like metal-dependent hydrolase (beta-lactamase superfamily II)
VAVMDPHDSLSSKAIIPHSESTVDVSIIDTTTRMGNVPGSYYLAPSDHYPTLLAPGESTPSYSFLVVHAPSRTKILFDLGLRVDWRTAVSPVILKWVRDGRRQVSVEKDVASILHEGGVEPKEIAAVIFSHQHFDHTGDPSRLTEKTRIIVGPGYKRNFFPGWPESRRSWETTSDLYHGREVVEISFSRDSDPSKVLDIGGFRAYDYFGDGSFYLLDTPGHTAGHISALARTTPRVISERKTEESTFILLGGDIAHNCALFRPTPLSPLPGTVVRESIKGAPETHVNSNAYATSHRAYSEQDKGFKARTTPFCTATGPHHDLGAAQHSIDILGTFDGLENVFTVLAHDPTVKNVVDLFPQNANDWKKKGWREACRWGFLAELTGHREDPANPRGKAKM